MTEKIWNYKNKSHSKSEIKEFSDLNGIPPLAALLLLNRGIKDQQDVRRYIKKSLDAVNDPFLMNDMQNAAERIVKALESHEKITVYGDYDVDGVTSAALLVRFLREHGADVDYYIPSREKEGYGINVMAINKISKNGTKLLITVDCGITSVGEVELAKTLGMDVIVTDHHLCKEKLPSAIAVIDCKRPDSEYPFPSLAGVGVTFKLVLALAKMLGERTSECFFKYVELAAVGTVADVVELLDENRVIVEKGLSEMKKSPSVGIKELTSVSGADKRPLTAVSIAFMIAPRINAAGRLGDAKKAVELLLTENEEEARQLAEELESDNSKRRALEQQIYEEALEMIEKDENFDKKKVIVLAKEGWHHGVIGIVSSRITETFYKPSILISADEKGRGKGSGRSIDGFNLFEALNNSKDLLTAFGGHAMAAGVSLDIADIDAFSDKINKYANAHISERDLIPKLNIDCELSPAAITLKNAKMLSFMEPFGEANPKPIFSVSNALIKKISLIGEEQNHVRMTLEKNGILFNAVGFRMAWIAETKHEGDFADCAFSLEVNAFRGEENVQLLLKDVK